MSETKKKKKLSFPTAFTVLFIVLFLSCILTYIIPAGLYSKLSYDSAKNVFAITDSKGNITEMPATQESLDQLKITGDIEKFLDGSINKPVSIPGTYEKVEQKPQGAKEFIIAPISGVYDTIGIILFVFILGGIIGVLNAIGAFSAGIAALSRATKGKEFILIIAVTALISLGGTTFGLAEETIALYPILVPVFLAAKYDVLVCIASVYMGSCIGTMFATIGPFSVVVASNAAGISFANGFNFRLIAFILGTALTIIYILLYAKKVKKDPSKSFVYDQREEFEAKFKTEGEAPALTLKFKIILLVFIASFGVLVYGVASQGWWFEQMTALFLVTALIIGFLSGLGEKEFINQFLIGAGDLLGVAFIVGIARSINIVLENGMVSDTILYFFSNLVMGMNKNIFIVMMLFIYLILGFFIPSTSGMAVLSIPIMVPLADSVGIGRDAVISAYVYGQGLMAFITPTGLALASLAMVNVTYNKWLKLILPFMGILVVFCILMLILQVNL